MMKTTTGIGDVLRVFFLYDSNWILKRRTIMLFSCCWMFQLLEGYYNNLFGQ